MSDENFNWSPEQMLEVLQVVKIKLYFKVATYYTNKVNIT
jgi:hypothetical protein